MDTFSFGVMMVHVLSGKWPFPGEAVQTNPKHPNKLIAVSEFDRRESTITLIQATHPLMSLIKQCLSNSPSLRPTTCKIHEQVSTVAKDSPPSFSNKAVMLETIKVLREENTDMKMKKKETRVENDTIIMERDITVAENVALTLEVEKLQEEMLEMKLSNELLEASVKEKTQEFLSQKASLMNRVGSMQTEQECTQKQIDLFTSNSRFSLKKCSTFDVKIFAPVFCTNKVVCFGNDAYIVYTHRPVYRTLIFQTYSFLHFNCNTDTWRSLPLPPVSDFSIGQLFEKLLAVGGHVTSDIYEFDEVSQQWVKSTTIPPMPTARSLATVATWKTADVSALIVCGGQDHKLNTLATVEVFHSVTSQWHIADPSLYLPRPRHSMKHLILQNTLYLMGGEKRTRKCSVFCISIPDLLESCLEQQPSRDRTRLNPAKWQTLPDVPSVGCFPVSLNGQVLAVEETKTSIYVYSPALSSWSKLGCLPFDAVHYLAVEYIFSFSVSSDELLIIESRLEVPIAKRFLPAFSTVMHFTANKVGITV